MSPSKRLKPVQKLARNREQDAARTMGRSHQTLQQEEAKLLQLKLYHQEYLERFDEAAKQGISANRLQEYRAFLARLDLAIREQENVVEHSKIDHSSKKLNWRKKHTRTEALNKVVNRHETNEKRAEDRREQKESDERSQRRNE
jgi:flagellar FliJ protein